MQYTCNATISVNSRGWNIWSWFLNHTKLEMRLKFCAVTYIYNQTKSSYYSTAIIWRDFVLYCTMRRRVWLINGHVTSWGRQLHWNNALPYWPGDSGHLPSHSKAKTWRLKHVQLCTVSSLLGLIILLLVLPSSIWDIRKGDRSFLVNRGGVTILQAAQHCLI